ncbi:hypothetical protein JNJ66_00200 [Candidatus Saccharibacteria bacterium]|nr:hypothetical protein [Candidatus Saccharibacteria bacterium]
MTGTSAAGTNGEERNPTGSKPAAFILIAVLLAGLSVLVGRFLLPAAPPESQPSRVEQAATFLQVVGFGEPEYIGIRPGATEEYSAFRARAIGGEPVVLLLHTKPDGGLEIQPEVTLQTVASAHGLASMAQTAVYEWENMPPDIQPQTDGSFGEYERRKSAYDLMSRYNPPWEYWFTPVDMTAGWPRQ